MKEVWYRAKQEDRGPDVGRQSDAVKEDGRILRLAVDAMVLEWNLRDHVGVNEADQGDCRCPSVRNSI